ncbi:hypothetical protein [Turicimonas muris]|uniref:hypothetical protein n=1 Tax=Turicimonas muris TaxID=1796652 RepID=UPI002626F85D|nr:hypothetical protein [Turicimonas muris]
MLRIEIPKEECYDEESNEFFYTDEIVLELEHSLSSISKWESKWHKPFLDPNLNFTIEEFKSYIKCMSDKDVSDEALNKLTYSHMDEIETYMGDKATATWFSENDPTTNRGIITSEILYYQMIYLGIPFECQYWHFNKLITLIRVCSLKGNEKKMSQGEILQRNRELNEARKAKMNTKG